MMERCPYCFKPMPESGVCGCRYEESANARIEEALHPGAVVGACYQIGAVLGKGGFGITYKAFDLNMKKVVAVKEFYPEGLVTRGKLIGNMTGAKVSGSEVLTISQRSGETYSKSLDLFYREAEALGKLDKTPNVVHAHHIFRENGTAYIVMEFVEGQSLKAMIAERGRIPERELLDLLDPVLTALDKVHAEKILHRDIAPDNIMIEKGQPVLLDFGASRVADGNHSSLVIGKKGYSSPEQIAGMHVDERSDIYSMGATYYKALSGITPQDSAIRSLNDYVTPLKHLGMGISPAVSDTVMKAMAVRPEDRFESAAAFQKALNEKTEEPPVPSVPETDDQDKGRGTSGNDPAPKPEKRPKIGAIAALILAVLAGAFFLFRPKPGTQTDFAATTQAVIDAELMKIAEAQTIVVQNQTATAQMLAHEAIATEWMKLTEARGAEETEVARPTDTPEPTDTPTAVPTATDTPKPSSTPNPTDQPMEMSPAEAFKTGNTFRLRGDYQSALPFFEYAAKQGYDKAQYVLGYMYEKGLGVDLSIEKALEWYRKAAEQGHSGSKFKVESLTVTPMPVTEKFDFSWRLDIYNEKTDELKGISISDPDLGDLSENEVYVIVFMVRNNTSEPQDLSVSAEINGDHMGWPEEKIPANTLWSFGAYGPDYISGDPGTYDWTFYINDEKADEGSYTITETKDDSHDPTKTPRPFSTPTPEKIPDRFDISWWLDIYNEKTDELTGKKLSNPDIKDLSENERYSLVCSVVNATNDPQIVNASIDINGEHLTWDETTILPDKGINYFTLNYGEPGTYEWTFYIDDEEAAEGSFTIVDTAEEETSALTGDPTSDYERGHQAFENEDYETALPLLRAAADAGNTGAMVDLGRMYYRGNGFEKNYVEAVTLFRQAAGQNDPEGQYWMGDMYRYGNGVPQDYMQAYEWYQKAADQGNDDAVVAIGDFYRYGYGLAEDPVKALEWYRKAADNGYDYAMARIGALYESQENFTGAENWYLKAIEQQGPNKAYAEWRMGFLYFYYFNENASDAKKASNYAVSREWYQKAADHGYAYAWNSLGDFYYSGDYDVEQSYGQALFYYRKGAEAGNSACMRNLAGMYYHGYGVPRSIGTAIDYLRSAMEKDDTYAYLQMGLFYEFGIGVDKDETEARRLYQYVADNGHESVAERAQKLLTGSRTFLPSDADPRYQELLTRVYLDIHSLFRSVFGNRPRRYLLMDLDGDGMDELVLGSEYGPYEIFTLKNGYPEDILKKLEENSYDSYPDYTLCRNKIIRKRGYLRDDPNIDNYQAYYRYTGNGFSFIEAIVQDESWNYYHSTTSETTLSGRKLELSEKTAIEGKYPEMKLNWNVIPD